MKTFIILFIVTLFLNADYLNTKTNNICVYDLEPYQNNNGWCYTDRSSGIITCDEILKADELINGYVFVNGECHIKNDLSITGLTQNQWDYLLAVLANILGFTMLFLINYLSILVAKSGR